MYENLDKEHEEKKNKIIPLKRQQIYFLNLIRFFPSSSSAYVLLTYDTTSTQNGLRARLIFRNSM